MFSINITDNNQLKIEVDLEALTSKGFDTQSLSKELSEASEKLLSENLLIDIPDEESQEFSQFKRKTEEVMNSLDSIAADIERAQKIKEDSDIHSAERIYRRGND